jgi:type VI secretion system secreted protein VgrG
MIKMRASCLVFFTLVLLQFALPGAYAGSIDLGTAAPFAVLGEAGVMNTGPSVIYGSVAGSAGTPAVTGFTFSTSPGPGTVVPPGVGYTTGAPNSSVVFGNATTAYDTAAGLLPVTETLTGQDLGGLTLTPGVYFYKTSAQLTGQLTLDFQNLSNQAIVFQIGSALNTATDSSVVIIQPGSDDSVYWQVGTSATLGTTTSFYGSILADASVTLDTGANIACGRAVALNGSVTLDDNTISIDDCETPAGGGGGGGTPTVPEPGSMLLMATFLMALGPIVRKKLW